LTLHISCFHCCLLLELASFRFDSSLKLTDFLFHICWKSIDYFCHSRWRLSLNSRKTNTEILFHQGQRKALNKRLFLNWMSQIRWRTFLGDCCLVQVLVWALGSIQNFDFCSQLHKIRWIHTDQRLYCLLNEDLMGAS